MIWLANTYDLLRAEELSFALLAESKPGVGWNSDFLLKDMALTIPKQSRNSFLQTICKELSLETLLSWLDDIARFESLDFSIKAMQVAEYVADVILLESRI